ncbi:PAS domain-containing hybrid sensor histidine kinase/response regulator [Cupriavidus pampae]|uniref:histidine kinase n=1 Tax=Cupriavidus pampae TaxID=659251 RepID=A0ABM8Y178_9BURK|nr:PAS domain S-box protein [Cupriavidus pampae]CAG9186482.1 Sensor histidine kinase RcsC [Cupriavidus pampae]
MALLASTGDLPLPPHNDNDIFRNLVDSISDYAIFTLDRGGHITSWNKGAEAIKGYTADEVIGRHLSTFYTAEAVARQWPQRELEIAARNGRLEDEGWRVRKDGSQFWANVIITALHDTDGNVIGFGKVTRDMTEKKLHLEQLRESERMFRLLVQSVSDYAIFMLDAGGHVISWNTGAAKIKGYSNEEILGRHFSQFYPPEALADDKPGTELREAKLNGSVQDCGWRVRKDGSLFWAHVTITAVYDEQGKLRGYAKVTRDMSDQRRLEDIEASARRMNEFLAILGHELRNPLSPISTATSAMELLPEDSGLVKKNLSIVRRQLTHVTRLVDDLLDVGRLSAGKLELRRASVPVHRFLYDGIDAALPTIHAKSQHLTVGELAEPMIVNVDVTRLAQVLQNVLLNASKFSPVGSTIELYTRAPSGFLEVEVRDQGRGIAPGLLEDIFNLFVQEGRPGSTASAGLGIGLSLARAIVEMHGGSISAMSAGAGKGSQFTFRIPRGTPADQDKDNLPLPAAVETALHILVVDDNQDAADSMGALLQMLGHEVSIAYNGAMAILMATKCPPNVALIDLAMPDMDGFELLGALKKIAALSATRFLALTGFGHSSARAETSLAGFHAHLVKPVDIHVLLKSIAT